MLIPVTLEAHGDAFGIARRTSELIVITCLVVTADCRVLISAIGTFLMSIADHEWRDTEHRTIRAVECVGITCSELRYGSSLVGNEETRFRYVGICIEFDGELISR